MYLTHLTMAGERWDQIAWRYYGDALAYEQIIAANPHVRIGPVLTGGLTLSIPVIEQADLAEELPLWMR
ncbi:tail protein X [Chromobacterium sp. IIBBL 290-4]|uniref:tail protein X n=1 Tax=Chromobacterium sp. IIBBL 290-4 TaxID=2953890 RepID=UPI0020B6DE48|nr:tail protein X [Chromobacterium sp. IIBBL 290-4]UTH73988.1 tail protein X [Chromobacterium sp. IIBBL 290-4]